jgi:hypothetical protein
MTRTEWLVWTIAVLLASCLVITATHARDDGRYADSALKPWFDSLASKKGMCCSFADGRAIEDVDVRKQDGYYEVRIDGEWVRVPDEALVDRPNKFGAPVVWPYKDQYGKTQIRCFIAGAGA